MTIFGGSLADKYGAKPFIVSGMLLRSLGFFMLSLASTKIGLLCACALIGIGGALFESPRSALSIKLVRARERHKFYSLLTLVDNCGIVAGVLIGSLLIKYDFSYVAIAGAIFFALCAAVNAWLLPAYRISTNRSSTIGINIKRVCNDRRFVVYSCTLAGYFLLMEQTFMLLPITVKAITGRDDSIAWMYMLEIVLSSLLLYPISHFFNGKFSARNRIILGVTLMTAGLFFVGLQYHVVALWVSLSIYYIGTLIAAPAQSELTAELANPEARGAYVGFSRLGLGIGGALGNFGCGWLIDKAHILNVPFLPWATLTVIGAVTMLAFLAQFMTTENGIKIQNTRFC